MWQVVLLINAIPNTNTRVEIDFSNVVHFAKCKILNPNQNFD